MVKASSVYIVSPCLKTKQGSKQASEASMSTLICDSDSFAMTVGQGGGTLERHYHVIVAKGLSFTWSKLSLGNPCEPANPI